MATILARIRIKPDRLDRFEAIERELAAATHAHEPDCLRYECWRAAEPNSYYVLLGFRNAAGFYNHQISAWHEAQLDGLYDCFDSVELEFVDPVPGAGSPMPPTRVTPPSADATPRELEYREQMPIIEQDWWRVAVQS
ncbi:MAG: antibiotic biosynthesis monooxygenase [Sphingomonadaceae bacterium]